MESGDLIADKYRLERVLGEGGMGTVYAATHAMTGKPVAIKCLHADLTENEEYTARFLREAQVAGRIDHPNVVNIFDVGRHDSTIFLVMELLQGETLAARLERGPQDPITFIQLMLPALRGVHAAHRSGVTHRDLKPDNIFLPRGPDGEFREAKVLDFGISKIGEELASSGRKQLTIEGAIFGTPQYMAPEQIRNARNTDARSDVYALGVIFYRALSGEFPFDSETLPGLALRIVEGNPVPLAELCPELEPELAALVMRALAVDPKERFASVAAFGEALEPYAEGYTFATSPGGNWLDAGTGERFSGDLHARTPSFRRAPGQRTPASQPRFATPAGRTGDEGRGAREPSQSVRNSVSEQEVPVRSPAAPTPAGQMWQRARTPALGLGALLFLCVGGATTWMLARSWRDTPTSSGQDATSGRPRDEAPARPSEPAPALAAPVPPVLAAQPALAAQPSTLPDAGVAEPSPTTLEAQPVQPSPPPSAGDSERHSQRRERHARRTDPEARPLAPEAAPAEPTPAHAEPVPKQEPAARPLQGTESNPYLRR